MNTCRPKLSRKSLRQRLALVVWLWSVLSQLPFPVVHAHAMESHGDETLSRHLDYHHGPAAPISDELHLHLMMVWEFATPPVEEDSESFPSQPMAPFGIRMHQEWDAAIPLSSWQITDTSYPHRLQLLFTEVVASRQELLCQRLKHAVNDFLVSYSGAVSRHALLGVCRC